LEEFIGFMVDLVEFTNWENSTKVGQDSDLAPCEHSYKASESMIDNFRRNVTYKNTPLQEASCHVWAWSGFVVMFSKKFVQLCEDLGHGKLASCITMILNKTRLKLFSINQITKISHIFRWPCHHEKLSIIQF
jgi:hypothetical protein